MFPATLDLQCIHRSPQIFFAGNFMVTDDPFLLHVFKLILNVLVYYSSNRFLIQSSLICLC